MGHMGDVFLVKVMLTVGEGFSECGKCTKGSAGWSLSGISREDISHKNHSSWCDKFLPTGEELDMCLVKKIHDHLPVSQDFMAPVK